MYMYCNSPFLGNTPRQFLGNTPSFDQTEQCDFIYLGKIWTYNVHVSILRTLHTMTHLHTVCRTQVKFHFILVHFCKFVYMLHCSKYSKFNEDMFNAHCISLQSLKYWFYNLGLPSI